MKIPRFLLVLLGGLLANALVFAQSAPPTLHGKATQEMFDEGFTAAAPSSYPLNSKAIVTNTETEEEIEVTITEHIFSSPDRIVDLSFDAWEALELDLYPDTIVSLRSLYVPPPAVAVAPEPDFDFDDFDDFDLEPEIAPPATQYVAEQPVNGSAKTVTTPTPAPATAQKSGIQPLYHLLVLDRLQCALDSDLNIADDQILYKYKHGRNGFLIVVYTTLEEPTIPPLPDKSRLVVNVASRRKLAIREYVNSAPFKRFVTNKRVLAGLQETLADIKIIPGLPKADNGKTYRLQIGAFPTPETAAEAERILAGAGFTVGRETYRSLYRVIAENVPSAHVSAAVRRLEFAGFTEVWIRE